MVVEYSVKKTYGHVLGKIEKAFAKETPLFALALPYPLACWKGDPTDHEGTTPAALRTLISAARNLS